jgi:type VI secretion system secreted protein VgrG
LRTDAHGVIRAAQGMLLTTEGRDQAQRHVKSLDEARNRLQTAQESHATLADLANQHEAQEGAQDEVARTLDSQVQEIAGQGSADPEARRFPEFERPHLTADSPAGIALSAAETLQIASGGDTAITTQGHVSVASQGGLFASVAKGIRLFVRRLGWRLIAARGDIDIQALRDNIKLAARLSVVHNGRRVVIQAEEKITLNGGGSTTRWHSGGIEYRTLGGYTVHSAGLNGLPGKEEPVHLPDNPIGQLDLQNAQPKTGRDLSL